MLRTGEWQEWGVGKLFIRCCCYSVHMERVRIYLHSHSKIIPDAKKNIPSKFSLISHVPPPG